MYYIVHLRSIKNKLCIKRDYCTGLALLNRFMPRLVLTPLIIAVGTAVTCGEQSQSNLFQNCTNSLTLRVRLNNSNVFPQNFSTRIVVKSLFKPKLYLQKIAEKSFSILKFFVIIPLKTLV